MLLPYVTIDSRKLDALRIIKIDNWEGKLHRYITNIRSLRKNSRYQSY